MKRIIFGILALLLLVILGIFIYSLDEPVDDASITTEEETIEPTQISPEMKLMSYQFEKTYEITEEDIQLYRDDSLLRFEFFEDVYRFSSYYDQQNNELSIIYRDITIYISFNEDMITINGEQTNNNLIINKAGSYYVNLDEFSNLFHLEHSLIEEPFFLLIVDVDSMNVERNEVEENMILTRSQLPEKINMTWEAVYNKKTDISKLYDMPGLDIISPVWYELKDGKGLIKSKKQDDYIEWAREKGYTLWPAVTNSFDTEITHEMMVNNDYRRDFIEKLVTLYENNNFPGINIDFENIYKEDKDILSHFIAELTAAFHRSNILVSMDITFAGGSDTWSKCYDRTTLGEWVDYIVIMAYDEHWASSPISGSVASLSWVDRNLNILANEVDTDKIILGVPFYMRVWFERPSRDYANRMKVTSDAITMHKMEDLLNNGDFTKIWDEPSGQYYISYLDFEDQALKKVWIEDSESLKLKVALVHKYGLKGIASWTRGYELESIWPILNEALGR